MATQYEIQQLIEKMAEERLTLLGQIEAFSEVSAEHAPADAEGEAQWSVKQQCCHLAEMETSYRAWLEQALTEDNPDVGWTRGEPVRIPLEDAHDHTVAELVAQLRGQREQTLAVIGRLEPADYDRTASQPMFGTLTVLQWLRSYYRHDRMHQDQIAGRAQSYTPRYAGGNEPDQRRTPIQ